MKVPNSHARIPERTQKFARGQSRVTARCRCGWFETWPRNQREASDAYRAHLKQMSDVSERVAGPTADPEYNRWYNRGWRYSASPSAQGLDHGDAIGAPDAWYDGYLDMGAGREKWHLPHCRGCPDHPDRRNAS